MLSSGHRIATASEKGTVIRLFYNIILTVTSLQVVLLLNNCPTPWPLIICQWLYWFPSHKKKLPHRVFSCHDGAKLYELRRGLKRTASIFSLSFSPCGAFLACSSNTETVHVFRFVEIVSHESEQIIFQVGRGSRNWGTSSSWQPATGGTIETSYQRWG